MSASTASEKPLVYSCSGCSNNAQLANKVAIELDRDGVAEMSCIAGVGGGVPNLVKIARSGRDIIALDGCPLHCVAKCLGTQGLTPTRHYTLTEHGIKKQYHMDYLDEDVKRIRNLVSEEFAQPVESH